MHNHSWKSIKADSVTDRWEAALRLPIRLKKCYTIA
jgi:hypothetical protein